MLRPLKMEKVMIVGPNTCLAGTVETLHRLGIIQFIDAGVRETGVFREGRPMDNASDFSKNLLRIRAAKQLIGPGREARQGKFKERDIDKSMGNVMNAVDRILEASREKQALLERVRYLEERKAEIEPLAEFPVKLQHYKGLESVEAFVGTVSGRPDESLTRITDRYRLFSSEDGKFIALFADRKYSTDVRMVLSTFNFKEFATPALEGDPLARIAELDSQIAEVRKRISSIEADIQQMSEKDAALLNAAEEVVSASVSKAEAPLNFSVTEREFVARGWVPAEDLGKLSSGLSDSQEGRVYVTVEETPGRIPSGQHPGKEGPESDMPPVKLRNTGPSRPYELLVRLFSLPSYYEYDPTIVVAVTFALFVGLMINDLGYGILMVVLGYILILYFRDSRDMRQLSYILMISGIAGALFGAFVFGLAFGFPIGSRQLLDPANLHVAEGLLLLCVVIGLVHMGIGYMFRAVESGSAHDYRSTLASAGWLAILLGFVITITSVGRYNLPIGSLIWHYLFSWVSGPVVAISMLAVPEEAIVLILAGLAVLIAAEGPFTLIEATSLLANVISYTRLGAIAIAGAALAEAINTMLMPGSFSANPGMFIGAGIMLVLAQLFVFLMLTLSASIQALRLNYIEFFVKFFTGGGRAYEPFGISRKYTVEA